MLRFVVTHHSLLGPSDDGSLVRRVAALACRYCTLMTNWVGTCELEFAETGWDALGECARASFGSIESDSETEPAMLRAFGALGARAFEDGEVR